MIVTGVGVHGQPSRLELRAFTGLAMAFAVVLVGNNVLIPNLNSAAMVPVGHVAGTAAAVFASVTTAAGVVMGPHSTTPSMAPSTRSALPSESPELPRWRWCWRFGTRRRRRIG